MNGKQTGDFSFLHFSDLHLKAKPNFRTALARRRLIKYLKEESDAKRFYCDFIFITGDIAYQNDYSGSIDFLRQLFDSLNWSSDKYDRVFFTAGNHDVDRNYLLRNILIKSIRNNNNSREEFEKLIEDAEIRDVMTNKGMKKFRKFLVDHKFINYRKFNNISYHSIYKLDSLNLIIINTCLTSFDDDDPNNMFIGEPGLLKVFDELDNEKPTIVLGHHGKAFFHMSVTKYLEDIFRDYSVDFYLCGHSHRAGYEIFSQSAKHKVHQITSGGGIIDGYSKFTFMHGSYKSEDSSLTILPYSYSESTGQIWHCDNGIDEEFNKGGRFQLRYIKPLDTGYNELNNENDTNDNEVRYFMNDADKTFRFWRYKQSAMLYSEINIPSLILLYHIAYFEPDNIPIQMFIEAANVFQESLQVRLEPNDITSHRELVKILKDNKLINKIHDNDYLYLSMNRKMQQAVIKDLIDNYEYLRNCLFMIDKLINIQHDKELDSEYSNGNYKSYLPHMSSVAQHIEQVQSKSNDDKRITAKIYNELARNYFIYKEWDNALNFYIKELEIMEINEDSYYKDKIEFYTTYLNIAETYKKKDDIEQALQWYIECSDIYDTIDELIEKYNDDSIDIVDPKDRIYTYDNIADICIIQNKHQQAIEQYMKILDVSTIYNIEDFDEACVNNNIANLNALLNNHTEALTWYKKAYHSVAITNNADFEYANDIYDSALLSYESEEHTYEFDEWFLSN